MKFWKCSVHLYRGPWLAVPRLFITNMPLAPQYLADQLTLLPGRADHYVLLALPMFFTFRHHCSQLYVSLICNYLFCNLTQHSEAKKSTSCTKEEQCGSVKSFSSPISKSVQSQSYSYVSQQPSGIQPRSMDNLNIRQFCSPNPTESGPWST